ncbi:hypothetical protein [Rufibacter sp. XAAS-G3-1]|uniref:hypothetical protein n=1 Tax=Rufibacter sp. XAAS-G3-1 TaxID=2729134 RepID=UPI0015E6C9F9|nr:hypothetical protein [Rufibacter sp. XAAS-G3-1]
MKTYIKFIVSVALLFAFKPTSSFAQINKNELALGLGLASGNGYPVYRLPDSDGGIYTAMLYAEYGLSNLFSAGPYFLYSREVATYTNDYYPALNSKDVCSGYDVGVRGSFNTGSFLFTQSNVHLYFTGFYGYTFRSVVYDKKNIYRDDFNTKVHDAYHGGLIGLSYHLHPKIELYGEAGFSKELILGVGFRFLVKRNNKTSSVI